MKIYKIASIPPSALPKVLTSDQMQHFIMDNGLQNFGGAIEYDDAKYIARHADKWELKEIPLSGFGWIADPKHKNPSVNLPPIVFSVDGKYEVLDGKHRIGMAKALKQKSIWAYVGEYNEDL